MNFLQRVFMNVSFKGFSEVGRRLISFAFIVFLTRTLGGKSFGQYSFFIYYTNLFAMIADAGLNTLYAREAAKEPQSRQEILSSLLAVKLFLAGVMVLLLASLSYLFQWMGNLDLSSSDYMTIAVFAIYWVLNSAVDLVNAVYIEQEKLIYDAAINLGHRVLAVLLGMVLVLVYGTVFAISIAYMVAAFVSLVVTLAIVSRRFHLAPRLRGSSMARFRYHLFEALPLLFSMFFSYVHFHIDMTMLKMFRTDVEVGWYSASVKILEFTMVIPAAAALVILPLFSRQFVRDKARLAEASGDIVRLVFVLGMFICLILGPLAGQIVPIFGKDFGPESQAVLQILAWTIPLIYVNFLLIYVLVACGRQLKNAIAAVVTSILNIALNYFLIQEYSCRGAAAATVATELLLMVLSARFVMKPLPTFRLERYITRAIAAAAVAGLVVLLLSGYSPWLSCIAALAAFALSLVAFKVIRTEDRELLKELLSRRVPQ